MVDSCPEADDGDEEKLVVFDACGQILRLEKSVVLQAEAEVVDEFVDTSVFHFLSLLSVFIEKSIINKMNIFMLCDYFRLIIIDLQIKLVGHVKMSEA